MGNRVWRQSTVSGQTTTRKYIIDISGQLPTILLEVDAGDSSLKKKYIYANGQILCQHDVPNNNNKFFYLHDRLGSVRLVINNQGAAQNSYTYNPFGESFDSECTENVTNPFKFTGQFFDEEINQYYLRARMYDPVLMRFTGRDPENGERKEPLTLHKYLYCLNSPVDHVDPTGKSLIGVLFGALECGVENAAALAIGGVAMAQTYMLVRSAAYQQLAVSMAASMSDSWNSLHMAVNLRAFKDKLYGYKKNQEGEFWLPPERPEDRDKWRKAGRITLEIIGLTPVWGLLCGLDEEGTKEALGELNQESDNEYYWKPPPDSTGFH
jgi:RHS repeat-associated protein